MRRYLTLAGDLIWVALSAVFAVLVRDNFILYESHMEAVMAYTAIAVATAAPIFVVAGLHTRLWQYTSLADFLRIIGAVSVALLAAISISFVASRLEGVARSVPLIQWFLLVGVMVGTRVAVRIWRERKRRDRFLPAHASVEHVLIVGLSHLTELYLQSVAEYASKRIDIVGILSDVRELRGRSLRFHKVLGTPEELKQVIDQLEVHGITLDRIVVMQPFEEISRQASDALLAVERGADVQVEWLVDRLGLSRPSTQTAEPPQAASKINHIIRTSSEPKSEPAPSFLSVKRGIDIFAALALAAALTPLMLVVALLVALDLGFPLVFWQKRPGRFGYPFKLFKFCTMRGAYDDNGSRLPDAERLSVIGRTLRRTRLDELPQLYNILIGEMSFVGPRPLLASDQPEDMKLRLSVRPGLTGLAQAYGERDMPAEDKNTLDVWYVKNASLWLDLRILLRTVVVFWRGERVHYPTLSAARAGLKALDGEASVDPRAAGRWSATTG